MNAIRGVLSILVMGAIAAFLVWQTAPGILRDWSLRSHYAPAAAEVSGDCRAYAAVVTFCDVTFTAANGPVKDTLLFVDFNSGDYAVGVVADTADPSRLSTSLGVEKYWNRVATFAGFVLIFAALLVGGALNLLRPKETPAAPAAT